MARRYSGDATIYMRHRVHGVFDVSVVTPSGRASFEVGPRQGGANDYDRMARQAIWLAMAMDARDPWGEYRPRLPRVEEHAIFDDAGEPVVTTTKPQPFHGEIFREYYSTVVDGIAREICVLHSSEVSRELRWCDLARFGDEDLFQECEEIALVMMDHMTERAPHFLRRAYDLGIAATSLGFRIGDIAIHGREGFMFEHPPVGETKFIEDILAATFVIERDEELVARIAERREVRRKHEIARFARGPR